MRKQEFLQRMCKLATDVRNARFDDNIQSDCVCTDTPHVKTATSDIHEIVVEYIEHAVIMRLNRSNIVQQKAERRQGVL